MSKEEFKYFVRKKPELINYVKNNQTSWQKLYEIYELYGEDINIWNKYLNNNINISNSFNDILSTIKKIDLNKLQTGIENIQNTISMIQNFGTSSDNRNVNEQRYKYKRMDD